MRPAWPVTVAVIAALAGCGAPPFIEVSATPRSAHEPSLATFRDGFVVAWYDTRHGHGEIYVRTLTAEGVADGPERRLTAGPNDAFEADVHAVGTTDFVVGWYEKTEASALLPRMGRWSRSGDERWVATLARAGRNTVVRVDRDLIFAAWIQDEGNERAGVWAGWWTTGGAPAIEPRRVASASRTTWNLNAAVAPSSTPEAPRAWLVFDAVAGTRVDELFAVDVSRQHAVVHQLTADDGVSSKYPDVGFSGGRVAITWFDTSDGNEDVYLIVDDLTTLTIASALETPVPLRVTNTPGHSIGAYLAWNGDRLGLAWSDDTDGQHEIFLQVFDLAGREQRPAARVTTTAADSLIPAIEPWGGGFALAWTEHVPGTGGHDSGGRGQVALGLVP